MKKATSAKKPTRKSNDEQGADILALLEDDHKPLKKLIKVLKKTERSLDEREAAFEQFAPLLLAHARAEETVLYQYMEDEVDQREEGLEGEVEHKLAEQLVAQIRSTTDEDLWSARVKVLAELVEHHVEEEEQEHFKDFRKETDADERRQLGQRYLQAKEDLSDEDLMGAQQKKRVSVEPSTYKSRLSRH